MIQFFLTAPLLILYLYRKIAFRLLAIVIYDFEPYPTFAQRSSGTGRPSWTTSLKSRPAMK